MTPSRRAHDRPLTSLCASMIGSGISSVGLVAGVAEHQALVAGAARVHAHRDVGRLAVNRREHGAGLGVEAVFAARVADFGDRLADDVLIVDLGGRGDFAGDQGEARRDQRFARHAAHGILRENGVENRV